MAIVRSAAMRRTRSVVLGLLALGGASLAGASDWGGTHGSTTGTGLLSLRGEARVDLVPNLRLAFDGAPADDTGTGTLDAYNEVGNAVVGTFPFTWERKGRKGFRAEVDTEALADYLAGLAAAATGGPVSITLDDAPGKGREGRDAGDLSFVLKARGSASVDGGPAVRVKARMRCR